MARDSAGWPDDGPLRRTVLQAAAATGFLAGGSASTAGAEEHEAAEDDGDTDDQDDTADDEQNDTADDEQADTAEEAVDEPDGFDVEILAEHASFPDEVAARIDLAFADDPDDEIVTEFEDASSVIVASADWDAGAESGWHVHPGLSIVTMVDGTVEVTWERDCEPRTYEAGDAWIDPGVVHKADSDDGAFAYVTFLGIPDGEPATEWVVPPEC